MHEHSRGTCLSAPEYDPDMTWADRQSAAKKRNAQTMKRGYRKLIDEAEALIETLSGDAAEACHGRDDVVFVDLRDRRELERDGRIPGAFHCPRGMLEFWIDPDSPYHKTIFAEPKKFIFYCASGWRSALATRAAQEMGLEPVCHIEGGYLGWKKAGRPTEEVEAKHK